MTKNEMLAVIGLILMGIPIAGIAGYMIYQMYIMFPFWISVPVTMLVSGILLLTHAMGQDCDDFPPIVITPPYVKKRRKIK